MYIEINEPALLNKCVRCHKFSNALIIQSIKKPLGKQDIRLYKINYSVCELCKLKLDKTIRIEDRYNIKSIKNIMAGILFILYIIGLIIIFITELYYLIGVLIIITFGVFFLSLIINRIYYKAHPEKLSNFFEIQDDGITILRDLESKKEIERFNLLSSNNLTQNKVSEVNFEFCPNCGEKLKLFQGFCQSCGKNLKSFQ